MICFLQDSNPGHLGEGPTDVNLTFIRTSSCCFLFGCVYYICPAFSSLPTSVGTTTPSSMRLPSGGYLRCFAGLFHLGNKLICF